jgi:catechol 2,3-dioxygenase-like lactoylglutathione lyase family enzyme
MLRDRVAMATVAVKDVAAARAFYRDTLGLEPIASDEPSVLAFETGGATLLVYQSQFAGTNEATVVTWRVGADIEQVVAGLSRKGVAFEHYDMPQTKRQGDLHVSGDMKVAWFKDPDGNIHSLVNR